MSDKKRTQVIDARALDTIVDALQLAVDDLAWSHACRDCRELGRDVRKVEDWLEVLKEEMRQQSAQRVTCPKAE